MKLKLLIAFMALSLVSCSDDDNSSNGSGQLDKYVITSYNEDGEAFDSYDIKFDNNRMTGVYFHTPSGQIVDKREFYYNENGSLSKIEAFRDDEAEPYIINEIAYDGEGKISTTNMSYFDEWGGESSSVSHYQYNSDNTITCTEEHDSGNVFIKTYYKNASGKIYKIIDQDEIQEVTYDGDNIATYSSGLGNMSYTFDNENTPAGPVLQSQLNQMNGNMDNTILFMGFSQITFGVSKYVVGQTSSDGSANTTYVYEFDSNGYPVKLKSFKEGSTQPSMIREIFYQ